MTITLIATYENGVLWLPHRLDLPEHARVKVEIERLPESAGQATDAVLQHVLALATDLGLDDLAEQPLSPTEVVRQALGLRPDDWQRLHQGLPSAAEIGRQIGSSLPADTRLSTEIVHRMRQ